jgi:hypothetical protein
MRLKLHARSCEHFSTLRLTPSLVSTLRPSGFARQHGGFAALSARRLPPVGGFQQVSKGLLMLNC